VNHTRIPSRSLYLRGTKKGEGREKKGEEGTIKTQSKMLSGKIGRRKDAAGPITITSINSTTYTAYGLPCIMKVLYYFIPWGVKVFLALSRQNLLLFMTLMMPS